MMCAIADRVVAVGETKKNNMKTDKALVSALSRADEMEKQSVKLHKFLVEKWEAAVAASAAVFYGCRDYGTHTAAEVAAAEAAAEAARRLVEEAAFVLEEERRQWRFAAADLRISEIREEVAL